MFQLISLIDIFLIADKNVLMELPSQFYFNLIAYLSPFIFISNLTLYCSYII